ncbi:MAG: TonB-dependent receptor, partial [Bryobacteraceae bacterium]
AMRAGVFPTAIRDSLNGRVPFPNNTIPSARIDPISAKVLAYIPSPNTAYPARNFNFLRQSSQTDKHLITVRTDHQLGPRDLLYGRYTMDDEQVVDAPRLPSGVGGLISPIRAQGFTINETHTFGPAFINQGSFGWTRFSLQQNDTFAFQKDVAGELGIKLVGLGADPSGWAFPAVTIQGFLSPAGNFPRPRSTDIFQARDTMFLNRGKHGIRIGGDFRGYTSDNFSPGQNNGAFTFQGTFTSNAFADFLLGWPLQATRNVNPASQNATMRYLGFFIADDWKVNDRLTLNLGIRYELETVLKEQDNEAARFDLATGKVIFPNALQSRVDAFYKGLNPAVPYGFFDGGLYNLDKNNFAPRVGLAYRPFRHQRTVVRGGFGMFYNAPQMTTLLSSVSAPPFSLRPSEISGNDVPEVRWNPAGNPEQAIRPPFTCFCLVTPDFPYSYVLQWAFNVQQALTWDISLEVGYLGSHTLRLIAFGQKNLTTPGAGNFLLRAPYPQWDRIQS